MKKYFVLILLLFFSGVNFATPSNQCSQQNKMAIETAVKNYLDKNSGLHFQDVIILKMQCLGRYASLILHPKKPVTDDATVYLHKQKQWQVLSMGTDFDEAILKQIPKPIRTY